MPSFTADVSPPLPPRKKLLPPALSKEEHSFKKISGSLRGLAIDQDLQTVFSRLGNKGLIVILAQPPSSSPMTA